MPSSTKPAALAALALLVACSGANGGSLADGGTAGAGATGGGGAGGEGGTGGLGGSSGEGGAGGVGGSAGAGGASGSSGEGGSGGEGGAGGQPPDGPFILFRTDEALFRALPEETDAPLELGTAPAPGTKLTSLFPSPDGRWVVYSAFGATWGSALYVAPTVEAGDPVRITREPLPNLGPTGGIIGGPKWNAASTLIAFEADYDSHQVYELYTSAPDGSLIDQKVNGVLTPGTDIPNWYGWDRDGNRLLYMANQVDEGAMGLYTSAPDGTENQNVTSAPGISRPFVTWSPTGGRVAYMASPDPPHFNGLFTRTPTARTCNGSTAHPPTEAKSCATHGALVVNGFGIGATWTPTERTSCMSRDRMVPTTRR